MTAPIMTRSEVADLLHITPTTLSRWSREGVGPSGFPVGRRTMYSRGDVFAWLRGEGAMGLVSDLSPAPVVPPRPVTQTVRQVADALGVSEWWVREQVKRGHVSPMRISDRTNARMRFTDQDVEQLIAALRPPEPLPRKRRRNRRAS